MGNYKDIIGLTFNRLTILEKSLERDNQGRSFYTCKCICGKVIQTRRSDILRNKVKSCGCLLRKTSDGKTISKTLYSKYEDNAKDRGYKFDLSFEDFTTLTNLDCVYCGEPPSNIIKNSTESYLYNGIDRVDNELGYTVENCVPCCRLCNFMKGSLSVGQFLQHCNKISKQQGETFCSSARY